MYTAAAGTMQSRAFGGAFDRRTLATSAASFHERLARTNVPRRATRSISRANEGSFFLKFHDWRLATWPGNASRRPPLARLNLGYGVGRRGRRQTDQPPE